MPISLNEKVLQGSTAQNYKELMIFLLQFLNELLVILLPMIKINDKKENKRDIRAHDIVVWYTKNDSGKHFIDY